VSRTPGSKEFDYAIIGGGIIGFAIGLALLDSNPGLNVVVIEKEPQIASHASGRNSGVIHAGFYYSPDSLKARFCKQGNLEIKKLAKAHQIPVNNLGKVVVTANDDEDLRLNTLFERGINNGVDLEILDKKELSNFEPLAKTNERFLWSPTTAVSSPALISQAICREFQNRGGQISVGIQINLKVQNGEIAESNFQVNAKYFINAAGVYSDQIARSVGIGNEFAMLPFAGFYRWTASQNLPLRTLIYPVPHPINPFLGVHFTKTIDDKIKIGPTAMPVFGRQQYSFREGWSLSDLWQIAKSVRSLQTNTTHDLSVMIKSEWPKLFQSEIVKQASALIPEAGYLKSWKKSRPGIRSQLVHLPTGTLEQDFVLRHASNSTHVLNVVSPGWTSALPFGRYVAEQILNRKP
jgi:L-2-hydroxyglutarate oxidase LhgO